MSKGSDKNVGSIEEDIRILQEKDCMWHYPETRIEEAIEDIIADYTRQKEINEEHQKINGELRQAINTVEKEKADWIKAYQEEKDSQFELLKRIQELEAKFETYMNQFIPKQSIIDLIENETISISGFECVAVEDIQELIEGEK